MNKKYIILFLILIVFIVISIGGIYLYQKNNVKEVPVYSVMDVGMVDYWQDNTNSEGIVREDKTQSIYLSSTQQVEKVLVKEGEKVKKGTTLIKYNTTLTNLEIERKQIDISKMELELKNAKSELEKIKTYVPNEEIMDIEVPIIQELPQKELKDLSDPIPEVLPTEEISPKPITGAGTKDNPYIFLWSDDKEYDKEFISKLILRTGNDTGIVYGIFMIREDDKFSGELISASLLKFSSTGNDYSFSIVKILDNNDDPIYKDVETVIPEKPIIEDIKPSYTASEIKKMILDKEKEISEHILNIKVAKAEYEILKSEIRK